MDWHGLQFLLALAHHKTLPGAAEALGVNRTRVSRRIEQMEADLEVRLIEKVGRELTLTIAGQEAVAAAEQIEELDFVSTYVTGEIPEFGAGKKMRRMIYTNSIDVAKELVAAGRGVTQIPCYMAEDDPRLVRISATQSDPLPEIWLLYHPRLRSQPRIRKFTEYLMACFEELKPAIEAG